ncbi:MAG TPA: TetR/AcrR family transcriptional regulator C-terminal domain-containing protein [Amycolatopsis sp.]|uniref:TetR family transcriptional regulator n=1 Tax=Amycolatopsis sp. TaxID=37632 RepID=UPI002F428177
MKVTRTQIVDRAYDLLRDHGLSSLSMRRVALDLGVQPGALYYHVANKQELLAVVATRVLEDFPASATDPRGAAEDFRTALLRVRDGAEVVSFVQAYRPEIVTPTRTLHRLFSTRLGPRHADWAARTVVHYVLGFVAEEQNRAELVHAGVVEEAPSDAGKPDEAFLFGVDAILNGLSSTRT